MSESSSPTGKLAAADPNAITGTVKLNFVLKELHLNLGTLRSIQINWVRGIS